MFRIVDWAVHFENNRTRELKKLEWVPFPNRHDGDGYTELLDHKNGPAHYGVWCALVQVASKCDPRGTLSRDGARPHDAGSLGRMIRMPTDLVSEAIERLIEPIRWLEVVSDDVADKGLAEIPQEGATAPQEGAPSRACAGACATNGTEWNRMEGNYPIAIGPIGEKPGTDAPRSAPIDQSPKDDSRRRRREEKPLDLSSVDWDQVTSMAETVGKRIKPRTADDRRAWLRYAVMAYQTFSEAWLMDAVEAVINAKETKRSKQAHFVAVLKSKAVEQSVSEETFLGIFRRIEIPCDIWKSSILEVRK